MSLADASGSLPKGVDQLRIHLQEIFAERLQALVLYGQHAAVVHSLALVSSIRFSDLSACAARSDAWRDTGLDVPLLLTRDEFIRSLDAFPLEYGDILSHHVVVWGEDPFTGLAIAPADRRRACEVEAKSHLIHLREGYLETSEQPAAIAALIKASAEPFRRLLQNVAILDGKQVGASDDLAGVIAACAGLPRDVIAQILRIAQTGELSAQDAILLYPAYLETSERLWQFLDSWNA
jgi:hypothetical protein